MLYQEAAKGQHAEGISSQTCRVSEDARLQQRCLSACQGLIAMLGLLDLHTLQSIQARPARPRRARTAALAGTALLVAAGAVALAEPKARCGAAPWAAGRLRAARRGYEFHACLPFMLSSSDVESVPQARASYRQLYLARSGVPAGMCTSICTLLPCPPTDVRGT